MLNSMEFKDKIYINNIYNLINNQDNKDSLKQKEKQLYLIKYHKWN